MSKTLIIAITALAALATPVLAADRQGSDEAANNELAWRLARGAGGPAYAAARTQRQVRNAQVRNAQVRGAFASAGASAPRFQRQAPVAAPAFDFQLQGRQ